MKVVLRTSEPVAMSFAKSVLQEAGIEAVEFDTHTSVLAGSMGFVPRRLMVPDEDYETACQLLREADVEPFTGKDKGR
ncbi:MAG: DUF2007 domain-containing protein [Alphaproteobacteria bacterium]